MHESFLQPQIFMIIMYKKKNYNNVIYIKKYVIKTKIKHYYKNEIIPLQLESNLL